METEMEVEREEGEMSDSEMYVEDIAETCTDDANKDNLQYKGDINGVIVQELEKVDTFKLEERAKRFGFSLTGNRVITQKQIDLLYRNFGVIDGNERHFRFDALHLFNVDGLSTKDIFEYLEDYKPVAIEWIDDKSCNIVCQDHISVALALLLHSSEIKDENLKEMLQKSSHHWREGLPHPKKDLILLRFATNSDKKMSKVSENKRKFEEHDKLFNLDTKNPWGDLCMSWGVYDHQEIFQRKLPQDNDDEDETELIKKVEIKNKRLALRLGKKNRKTVDADESCSDSEWKRKSKTPRMRMHADDEECKHMNKPIIDNDEDAYAPLSIEVVNTKSIYTPRTALKLSEKFRSNSKSAKGLEKYSIQSRLGTKVNITNDDSLSDGSTTSDHFDNNLMSRIQKVTKCRKPGGSVWSRLELNTNNKDSLKDLRQKLKSRKQKKSDDLRDVLSKTKQSNLRIEVDNNYVNK